MKDGFVKIAAVSPKIKLGDVGYNLDLTVKLIGEAYKSGARVALFPELSLTGATLGDLYSSRTLLEGAKDALCSLAEQAREMNMLIAVGLPIAYRGNIYNTTAVISGGQILGLVPKEHNECNSKFTSTLYKDAPSEDTYVEIGGQIVPLGKAVFECGALDAMRVAVAFATDAYRHGGVLDNAASIGATLVLMPSAQPEIIGAKDTLNMALLLDSNRYSLALAYAEPSSSESTGAYVFSGKRAVYECGKCKAFTNAFDESEITYATLDLDTVDYKQRHGGKDNLNFPCKAHAVRFSLNLESTELQKDFLPRATPFVPGEADLAERAELIISECANGLAARLTRSYSKACVLGISGGLDSTMALLTLTRATDILGWDRKKIIAVTMPCFGTTDRTKTNAEIMAESLGVTVRVIDIKASVTRHFEDISHDASNYNVVYENAQARERTQVLMDIANAEGGIVLGTGDLSEAALGFATYNGDHMSMYNVNASLPKTLIRALVTYFANKYAADGDGKLAAALLDVVNTPVSPELLPKADGDKIVQQTESIVGPYELNDFFLFTHVRLGYTPGKIFRVAKTVFKGMYKEEVIERYLRLFLKRFFAQQFKRTTAPEGVNIGTVSLSSTVGYTIPSDMSSAMWQSLEE